MKKRIGSFLLALVLTISLIPSLAVGASAATIDESYNTGAGKGGGGGALNSSIFSSAVVQNTKATVSSPGTAKSLEVVVKLKGFGSQNSIYALVMRATDYATYVTTSGGPKSAGIDGTSYFQQQNFNASYYAIGRKNPDLGTVGATIALPLVVANTENASSLGADKPVLNKTMPVATVTNDNYFDEYVLVVFSTEVASNDNYYVDHFYVDADGYVRTPSYLIRYNANNPAGNGNVNGTPNRSITRALPGGALSATTTLSGASPTRTGYTFLGWSKTAKTAGAGLTAADVDFAAGASYPKPETLYTVNDLHAVWKTIPVAFATVGGDKNQTVADEVRVGVTVSQTFNLDGAVSDGTKNYQVTQVTVGGTLTSDSTKFPNNVPAGMKLERSGARQWILSGTPLYDCDKPIVMTVEVTDQSNTTKDTMLLTIPKIEKGLQPSPDLDVNTGLSATMVDDGEESTNDGRLIGFYAIGQSSKVDSANASMTDGTGTYTNYYLTKGMIYEYRPKTAENTGAWREIPAPESLYDAEAPDWTDFEASFLAGATTRYKTTISDKTAASYAAITEVGPWTAWDAAYGAIQFVDGAPVVTGLAKDAVYEVRFRASDTFDASEPTPITVGGTAASSAPSGYSVLFNLMGGKVFKVTTTPSDVEGEEPTVTEEDVTDQLFGQPMTGLKVGDVVTLPTLELAANETLEYRKEGNTFAGFYDGKNTYTPDVTWSFTMPAYSVGLAAMWGASGEIDPNAVAAVTLFDWDNSYLGSVTVVKGATNEQVATTIDAYCKDDATIAAALAGKDGYEFTHWVDYDYEGIIAWGEKAHVKPSAAGTLLEVERPPESVFEGISENASVKAAYESKGVIDLASAPSRWYTFDTEIQYNKMGATNYYSITVTTHRKNSDGSGVQRFAVPAVRVAMATTGGTVYQLVYLDETDTATAMFSVNGANVTQVICNAVDVYETTNWTGGAAARGSLTVKAGTPQQPGFIFYGSLAFVNEQVQPGGTLGQISLAVLRDNLGLDLSAVSNNATTARTKIQQAREIKGDDLTIEEMQAAINN